MGIMVHEDIENARQGYPSLRKNQLGDRLEAGLLVALAILIVLLVVTLP